MSKESKGKSRGVIIVIILISIAVVALLIKLGILDFKGFGKGGTDEVIQVNATVSDTILETTDETIAETTVQEAFFVNITIDGEKYIYNNQLREIDELIEELCETESKFEVHILLGDTATLAAREELETRLDDKGIVYSVVEDTK